MLELVLDHFRLVVLVSVRVQVVAELCLGPVTGGRGSRRRGRLGNGRMVKAKMGRRCDGSLLVLLVLQVLMVLLDLVVRLLSVVEMLEVVVLVAAAVELLLLGRLVVALVWSYKLHLLCLFRLLLFA